jgi:DNA-binding NarL/FixJ family response regulator
MELTLATAGRNGTHLAKQLVDHTSELTITAVSEFDPLPNAEAVNNGECVVAVVGEERADSSALYEEFRRTYPTTPLVVITSTDDSSFIETVLDDEYSEYVYLPADDPPFGLVGVRCKQLVETDTTSASGDGPDDPGSYQ